MKARGTLSCGGLQNCTEGSRRDLATTESGNKTTSQRDHFKAAYGSRGRGKQTLFANGSCDLGRSQKQMQQGFLVPWSFRPRDTGGRRSGQGQPWKSKRSRRKSRPRLRPLRGAGGTGSATRRLVGPLTLRVDVEEDPRSLNPAPQNQH